ncbi:MAG: hypothetical protein FD174_1915 [Geobacteraceae bacterium]|nr:MAG: hypothetical protein FD174_1915 [Geobacteraceae bacterium]
MVSAGMIAGWVVVILFVTLKLKREIRSQLCALLLHILFVGVAELKLNTTAMYIRLLKVGSVGGNVHVLLLFVKNTDVTGCLVMDVFVAVHPQLLPITAPIPPIPAVKVKTHAAEVITHAAAITVVAIFAVIPAVAAAVSAAVLVVVSAVVGMTNSERDGDIDRLLTVIDTFGM